MKQLIIHCEPQIGWQGPFAAKLAKGLKAIGIESETTIDRNRYDDDLAIVLGTTRWRQIEESGPYLLIDRCSFGDTDQYVSLVLNGHGRRGNHRVPNCYNDSRWNKHQIRLHPWKHGNRRVVCGQTESYCDRSLEKWYRSVNASHFRRHPFGANPTTLPEWSSFDDCELVTLNSSVAIQGLIHGCRVEVHDEGGMAYGTECTDEGRLELMHWLAWTQWHHDEIQDGEPIKHLFEGL